MDREACQSIGSQLDMTERLSLYNKYYNILLFPKTASIFKKNRLAKNKPNKIWLWDLGSHSFSKPMLELHDVQHIMYDAVDRMTSFLLIREPSAACPSDIISATESHFAQSHFLPGRAQILLISLVRAGNKIPVILMGTTQMSSVALNRPTGQLRLPCCSVTKSCPTLQSHGLQHSRPSCPSVY